MLFRQPVADFALSLDLLKIKRIQESIPVGCVPSAAVAISRGCTYSQGVYLVLGDVLSPGEGVSSRKAI